MDKLKLNIPYNVITNLRVDELVVIKDVERRLTVTLKGVSLKLQSNKETIIVSSGWINKEILIPICLQNLDLDENFALIRCFTRHEGMKW